MPLVHEIFIGLTFFSLGTIFKGRPIDQGLILIRLDYQYCVAPEKAYGPLQGNGWGINKPNMQWAYRITLNRVGLYIH